MSVIPRDKVMEKIRKLIALSNSSNVHEAEVAAAAAQRLMLEHKIAASDITTETREEDVVMDVEVYRDLNRKAPPAWHSVLLNGVARANFCRVVTGREYERCGWSVDSRKVYRIIGTEPDRATVKYLYEMLRADVERLTNQVAHAMQYDRAERASFKLGAATSIAERVTDEWRHFKSEITAGANTQALAVIDKTSHALTAFVKKAFPHLTYLPPPTASRTTAYIEGREAGRRLDLRRNHRGLGPGQMSIGGG